jgi:hypothetical protein
MTAEQKVKQKYPDAKVVWNKKGSLCSVQSSRYKHDHPSSSGYISMFYRDLPRNEFAAWRDALARMEATHE